VLKNVITNLYCISHSVQTITIILTKKLKYIFHQYTI